MPLVPPVVLLGGILAARPLLGITEHDETPRHTTVRSRHADEFMERRKTSISGCSKVRTKMNRKTLETHNAHLCLDHPRCHRWGCPAASECKCPTRESQRHSQPL